MLNLVEQKDLDVLASHVAILANQIHAVETKTLEIEALRNTIKTINDSIALISNRISNLESVPAVDLSEVYRQIKALSDKIDSFHPPVPPPPPPPPLVPTEPGWYLDKDGVLWQLSNSYWSWMTGYEIGNDSIDRSGNEPMDTFAPFTKVNEPNKKPVPPTPITRLKVSNFKLVGGIRIKQEFNGGGLAIDFNKKKIYNCGHATKFTVCEYDLPEIGLGEPGTNHANWPIATKVRDMPQFWLPQDWKGNELRPFGLAVINGKLWCSPRVFYDMGNTGYMTIVAEDGERKEIRISRAKFGGGFVKGYSEPLVGNGGYLSGQGSCAGPTAAKLDGTVLLDQVIFGDMRFEKRTKRPSGSWSITGKDEWYAFIPRKADGTLCTQEEALAGVGEGAWNSDTIIGGGIWTPRGLLYWAQLGFGVLDYKYQSEQFAASGASKPYLYTYSPDFSWGSVEYEPWPWGQIHGCEIGPDGRLYLLRRRAWKSGMYVEDSAIYVFEIA